MRKMKIELEDLQKVNKKTQNQREEIESIKQKLEETTGKAKILHERLELEKMHAKKIQDQLQVEVMFERTEKVKFETELKTLKSNTQMCKKAELFHAFDEIRKISSEYSHLLKTEATETKPSFKVEYFEENQEPKLQIKTECLSSPSGLD